jgi:hypothetical protein
MGKIKKVKSKKVKGKSTIQKPRGGKWKGGYFFTFLLLPFYLPDVRRGHV